MKQVLFLSAFSGALGATVSILASKERYTLAFMCNILMIISFNIALKKSRSSFIVQAVNSLFNFLTIFLMEGGGVKEAIGMLFIFTGSTIYFDASS